jgi:hypothetical protein
MKAKLTNMGYEYRKKGGAAPVPLASVSVEEILTHRTKDKKLDDLLNGSIEGYPSRSEAELALVCKLLFYGGTKEQIFNIMENGNIGKWKERPESYKHMTYNRGVQFLSQKVWSLEELNHTRFDAGGPQDSADKATMRKKQKLPIFYDENEQDEQNGQDAQDAHPFRGLRILSLRKFLQGNGENTTK